MAKNTEKICVLASSRDEYRRYIAFFHLNPKKFRYLASPEATEGLRGSTIMGIGGFYLGRAYKFLNENNRLREVPGLPACWTMI